MDALPAGVVLEIGPGFGRISEYLKYFCDRLILVDLTPRCIEACKDRFRTDTHVTCHVNDGKSLEMIPERSIDFVFSFDTLVHAESDVLRGYLLELSRKLSAAGTGFIHHSNLAASKDPATGKLPFEQPPHWRAASMSAELFRDFCREAGLQCTGQEIVNWGGTTLHDCFSAFTRHDSPHRRACRIRENAGFMTEAHALGAMAAHNRK
jgi:hypothetical protein